MKDAYCTSGSSPGSMRNQPDFTILVDGSIALLTPHSISARLWIENNVGREGFQPYWPVVVIENRYIADIVRGAIADGLAVRG